MRTLLLTSAALLGFVAAPLIAHAAGVTPAPAGPTIVVAQSTALPPVTVTAPPPMNPWDISTWRFHAGQPSFAPEGRPGFGASTSSHTGP